MPTVTLHECHEQLQQCLDSGDSYRFLTLAEPYLTACPDDSYVRLLAARQYLRLGLIRPARDILDSGPSAAALEIESARQSLQSLDAPPISWEAAAAQFERNLQALRTRGFDPDAIEAAWGRDRRRFEWFCDANGQDQVRGRMDSGQWSWFGGLRHHASADIDDPLPGDMGQSNPGPYLFDGLGLGGCFERVCRATANSYLGFSCALFVVEPDAASLAVVLHLRDWRAILADPRVLIFTGLDWAEALAGSWQSNIDLPFPQVVISPEVANEPIRIERSDAPSAKIVRQSLEQRGSEVVAAAAQVEAQYQSRDIAYSARRFADALSAHGRPLRILAGVSMHTTFLKYSMRDAIRALEALRHQCRLITEAHPYDIVSPLTFHRAILEFDPDVFFVFDHFRSGFTGLIPKNLPILTWDQDQLPSVLTGPNVRSIAPHDYVVGYCKAASIALGGRPEQFLYTRVPTCPEQFGGPSLTDQEHEQYACDVSYVSHASETPKAFHEQERARYEDQSLKRLLDAMFELMPAMVARFHVPSSTVLTMILREAAQQVGVPELPRETFNRLNGWYLWRLADRIFRHTALEWVADWARRNRRTLCIYGNGWEKHPTLSAFAAGPAHNDRELLCVYRASRINLQIMPAGFIHQRALDGLCAGGFFLTRVVPRDLQGDRLHELADRVRALKITSTRGLLEHPDGHVRRLLREVCGDWLRWVDPGDDAFLVEISTSAELLYPDQVFPRFRDIAFDSPESFAAAAHRFLEDEPARCEITMEMRQAVIERFGYRSAMEQFLVGMCAYLSASS